jgi:hypothetical protein
MKVVTFFKSSTTGGNDLVKVQEELHDHPLVLIPCKTKNPKLKKKITGGDQKIW